MKKKLFRRAALLLLGLILAASSASFLTSCSGGDLEERLYKVLLEGLSSYPDSVKYASDGVTVRSGSTIDVSSFKLVADSEEDVELLNRVYFRVINEHPEIFYVREGFNRVRDESKKYIAGVRPWFFDFENFLGVPNTPEGMEECARRLDEAVDAVLAKTEGVSEPVEKLLILYDELTDGLIYNRFISSEDTSHKESPARSAYSALVEKDAVCKGVSMALKLLIDRMGDPRITCTVVYNLPYEKDGRQVQEADQHVWNMVSIDGKWYHVDANRAVNSMPSTPGYQRHERFLITDETMLGAFPGGWRVKADNGWKELPACTDDTYESGWAFNGSNFKLFRSGDGDYYYLRDGALWRGTLSGEGERLAGIDCPKDIRTGVVWQGGALWYVNAALELVRYDLADGEGRIAGKVPFSAAASGFDEYDEGYDGIGLRYDGAADEIVAVSRTTCEEIARFGADI